MNKIIIMLSIIVSSNLFASESSNMFSMGTLDVTGVTSSYPLSATSGILKAQAQMVQNDAQELMHSGQASVFLSQKIQETQEMNNNISQLEALDLLIKDAQLILSK